jgi:hypothetical protein
MAIVFTETRRLHNFRTIRILGTLAFTGNYVSGGEVPTGIIFKGGSTRPPVTVNFFNRGTHTFRYDPATGKVLAYAGSAEHAAAAYVAAITGDVVTADIEYNKLV